MFLTVRSNPYWRSELIFLVFLTFVPTLISDLEYNGYEEHNVSGFYRDTGYRVVTGLMAILSYGAYYWGFLKRYILRRRLLGVILCSLGFVIFDRIYMLRVTNWVVAHSFVVPPYFRHRALLDMAGPIWPVTFNYPLIAVILPLTGLAYFVRSLMQERQLKAMREQQLEAELSYLKAQLQPHFFFNTINNIYALALQGSADTAPLVARLGGMMRYILYEANQGKVLLRQEVEFLGSYIEVERVRRPLNYQMSFDTQGIRADHEIEPLLLLPFVENACKHSFDEGSADGYIQVVICQTEEELLLQVVNSKPGGRDGSGQRGIGLENVRKRLELLYPGRHLLDLQETGCRYQVNLTLRNI
jgi:hypothetical protein